MQKNALFLVCAVCLSVFLLNVPSESVRPTAPAGWIFYHHPKTGLSFYYPPDVVFNTQDGPDGNFGYAYILHKPDDHSESISFYVLKNLEHKSLGDFIVAHSGGLFGKPDPTLSQDILL